MHSTKSIRKVARNIWSRLCEQVRENPKYRVASPRASQLRLEALEERSLLSAGPYPPAAGQAGSTAIHKDDAAFVGWATGWQDYSAGSDVAATWQTPENAMGKAEGTSGDIVCLGRGGEITLTFETPIVDGPGWDFATFENGFSDTFLELGYVEVSSNGTDFFQFPNDSQTAAPVAGFGAVDPTNITGYCSKYKQGYGTPFDLADLKGVDPLLDVSNIGYVKIVDIVGDGSALDTSGDVIYDPYPTVGSAGVDLDAVGVIHTSALGYEDVGMNLANESYWNGPDPEGTTESGQYGDEVVAGAFESGGLRFNNTYSNTYGSWTGWAYSNTTDTTTVGYTNQFSAYAGSGASDSRTYAVAFRDVWDFYNPPTIERTTSTENAQFRSISVTNTTYAALSMREGDQFAKKFGNNDANGDGDYDDPGDVNDGSYPDWFLLTITGKNGTGNTVGEIEFYLADYRFPDDSQDYIVEEWTTIDLTPLENAATLEFVVTSSDNDPNWGMNTPAYFAADNITLYDPNADFEDANVGEALAAESYWNGSDGSGGFDSGVVSFNNTFTDWGGGFTSWDGWSYSNMTDTTTAGHENQYSAYTGEGAGGSPTYGVACQGGNLPTASLPSDALAFESIEIANTTYAALSMLNGDSFAKKFGGASGNDEDWFLLTIEGINAADESVGTVEFYLADYRFADNSQDYILDEWVSVDLTSLAGATSLEFSLSSSDVGTWGMNTPAYFAADNIAVNVNQPTYDDIIGRDPSTGNWWVAKSTGSSFLSEKWAKWSPSLTWLDVQVGDFNGDGLQDVIGRVESTGEWWVTESTSSGSVSSKWNKWSPYLNWLDVQVGDFNGDGSDDIAGRIESTGEWWVGISTAGSYFTATKWSKWSPNLTWVDVQVGDFNGDGSDDIAGRVESTGEWWMGTSTAGSYFATAKWAKWSPHLTWLDVQTGDFNGDGIDDIAGRVQSTGEWWVGASTGSAFASTKWAKWSTSLLWDGVQVGDFDNDGRDDIVGRVQSTGEWRVGLSTAGNYFATTKWTKWSPSLTWLDLQVGDFNGDGRDDIVGRIQSTGKWWVGVSTGSYFASTPWAKWSPYVTWENVLVGDFDGAPGSCGAACAATAAVDQFWFNAGSEDEGTDSLLVENDVVDLLEMAE